LAAPTSSSNGRPHGRGSGILATLVGLLSLATLPVAVAVARWREEELLDVAWAIPVAIVLGLLAMWLARRSRKRLQRAVISSSRGRSARLGRALGLTGLLVGVTAALAVGISLVLESVAD
jgi:NhaP-type Na+/H+ or K+/H+ antiporter